MMMRMIISAQIGKQIGKQSAKLFDANSGHVRKRGGHGEAINCVVFQKPLLNIRDQTVCKLPPISSACYNQLPTQIF